ncbi:hypothetical protein [Nocardia lijiangensis]
MLDHVRYEAGGHGFDMWARSGRVIGSATPATTLRPTVSAG